MNPWIKVIRIVAIVVFIAMTASAQNVRFHTGRSFERQLSLPASIFWSEVPLREAVSKLSQTRRLAIWLDRRCDPSQSVSFGANLPTLKECLWKLGEQEAQLDVAWLDDVIYLGPKDAANRVATIHAIHKQQIAKLPSRQRSKWLQKKPSDWPKLTSPTKLLADLETELGHAIVGKESVVHDLWPAQNLPPLPLFQRLELVLGGFNRTFTFDVRGGAKVVEMATLPRAKWNIVIPEKQRGTVHKLLKDHPTAKFENSQLVSSWRVYELIKRAIIKRTFDPSSAGDNRNRIRYTLQAENQPLGPFVSRLCKQLNLECEFTESARPELEQRISFQVKQVDLRTLFREILESTGLDFSLEGNRLRVTKSSEEAP